MPQTLTTAQIAAQRSVSVRTIHRMVEAGALKPHLKLPGKTGAYVFDEAEVERAFTEVSA